jgi:hypothetical protein
VASNKKAPAPLRLNYSKPRTVAPVAKTNAAPGLRFNGTMNTTGNARSGQTYRTIQRPDGVIHDYGNGQRVFVRKSGGAVPKNSTPKGNTARHYF